MWSNKSSNVFSKFFPLINFWLQKDKSWEDPNWNLIEKHGNPRGFFYKSDQKAYATLHIMDLNLLFSIEMLYKQNSIFKFPFTGVMSKPIFSLGYLGTPTKHQGRNMKYKPLFSLGFDGSLQDLHIAIEETRTGSHYESILESQQKGMPP